MNLFTPLLLVSLLVLALFPLAALTAMFLSRGRWAWGLRLLLLLVGLLDIGLLRALWHALDGFTLD